VRHGVNKYALEWMNEYASASLPLTLCELNSTPKFTQLNSFSYILGM